MEMDANKMQRKEAEFRQALPYAEPEILVRALKELTRFVLLREQMAPLGVLDTSPEIEQQYRLTAFAVEQEILRRLTAKGNSR